jgi:hypothetical protein
MTTNNTTPDSDDALIAAIDGLVAALQLQANEIAQLTKPKPRPSPAEVAQLISTIVPLVRQCLGLGSEPQRRIGTHEQQLQLEFQAEEAKFKCEFAEKRARLQVTFGPRFVLARELDEAISAGDDTVDEEDA